MNGNNYSTPDSAAVSITGDFSVEFIGTPSSTTTGVFLGKDGISSNRSFLFYFSSGKLTLDLSDNGTTITTKLSSTTVGATAIGFGVSWRQSDGRIQFWTTDNGTTWSALGTDPSPTAIAAVYD